MGNTALPQQNPQPGADAGQIASTNPPADEKELEQQKPDSGTPPLSTEQDESEPAWQGVPL